jgi:uncharacterized lipoprotein YmbA
MLEQLDWARLRQHIFLSLTLVLSTSCHSSHDEYYTLHSLGRASAHPGDGVALGVGRISLPSYIDRPELVFQNGPDQFAVPSDARWVGALRDNIARVLAEDLRHSLHAADVVIYPWPAEISPRYVVTADILQFHGISGSDAILEVSWRLEDGGKIVVRRSDSLRKPIKGDGYAAVVEAESQLLEQLAERIARVIHF